VVTQARVLDRSQSRRARLRASICIPSYKRREILLRTLESLNVQSAPPGTYEVIVADDGSADGTPEVLATLQTLYRLRLLPHSNLGVLSRRSLERLKPWNVSMGLMLENLRDDLKAHSGAYHKVPGGRRRHIADAGELRMPFTTGILMGIGESAKTGAAHLRRSPTCSNATGTSERSSSRTSSPSPASCSGPGSMG
jgi:cellulose synthase/poly-beta-1,6-N-acetylglucosamine synthase-like glycosyltransferase